MNALTWGTHPASVSPISIGVIAPLELSNSSHSQSDIYESMALSTTWTTGQPSGTTCMPLRCMQVTLKVPNSEIETPSGALVTLKPMEYCLAVSAADTPPSSPAFLLVEGTRLVIWMEFL